MGKQERVRNGVVPETTMILEKGCSIQERKGISVFEVCNLKKIISLNTNLKWVYDHSTTVS